MLNVDKASKDPSGFIYYHFPQVSAEMSPYQSYFLGLHIRKHPSYPALFFFKHLIIAGV